MDGAMTGGVAACTIAGVKKALNCYVFADKVRAACDVLNLQRARLECMTDPANFARAVTEVLIEATGDKHLRVRYAATAQTLRNSRENECFGSEGYASSSRLPGNIGYLRVLHFPESADVTYDNAMALVADTDALVVDLRGNPGGEPESVNYLLGYFFRGPVEVTGFEWRRDEKTEHQRMYSAAVRGSHYKKSVYVLIDGETFSGAEQFAYDMQSLERAQLIGEPTGGGANPGDWVVLNETFSIFVPTGSALNPYTKANWEGVGVQPDLRVPSADAPAAGYERARSTLGFSAAKPGSR